MSLTCLKISTVENPIYYTIMNTRSSQPGGLMYWAGDNVGMKDEQTVVLEDKHKFFFTGSHEAMYVHNAATGKKLATIGNGNYGTGSWTDEGTEWAVGVSPKGGGLAFGPKGGLDGYGCWNECNYQTAADKPDFTTWEANDAGSIFIVDLVEDYVFPVSDLFYVIECPLFEKVQGVKKAIYVNEQDKAVWGTEDLTNHNFYWIPTVDAETGKVALKNLGTGLYLKNVDGSLLSTDTTEVIPTATLKILGDCSFNINIGGTIHANNHGNGNGNGSNFVNWGGSAGSASAWRFVQKNDPTALVEVVVKYSFTYGGEEKYTQETTTLEGEEWPAITTAFPFGVSATKPAGEVSAEGAVEGVVTKVIELSVNLPFTYAADYASIEKWYYIQMHSNPQYSKYLQNAETYIEWADATIDAAAKDSYTWGFVGNPFDGFMLVNYGAGETKAVNSDGSKDPALGDIATGTKWVIKGSRVNPDAEHFCFQYPGSNNYMNAQSGKIAYWTDNDQGSTMWVTLRDDVAALQALVDAAEATLATWNHTGVGYVTVSTEHKNAISDAVAAAKTAIANNTGYDAAQATLEGAVAAAAAKTYTIQPDADKFYTIINAHTDHRGGQSIYVNKDGGMQFAKTGEVASEIARVFQFVPANDGKFYLGNIENGTYLSTANGHGGGQNQALATLTNNAVAVTITNIGKDNQVKIVPDGGAMIHAQDRGSAVVGWNADHPDDASAWKIVETELSLNDLTHTLTVSEAGWATLVLGYNTTIPTGVKAYAVSSIAENKVVLAEVAEVLPAHTPVLIEAAADNYAFNYTTTEATVASNLLAGSVFKTYVAPVEGTTNYVLSNNGGVVGLYKKTTENANGMIEFGANKAYLPVQTAAEGAPAMFAFGRGAEDDEESTGIESVELNGELVIYDLAGRRVQKMEKGIYIVNGKKVIK